MLSIYQDDVTLQTFADHESATIEKAFIKSGKLEDLEPWAWQENEKGAGIYVTVNQTDGTWRKENTITKVRAYYVDIDGLTSEAHKSQKAFELLNSKLPPSAIVKSGGGLHSYWYAQDNEPVDAEGFKSIEMGIIQAFDGCPRTKDIARVLRLPNFLHMKNPDKPYLIEVMYEDAAHKVTGEQLKAAYPYILPKPKYQATHSQVSFSGGSSEVWPNIVNAVASWSPVDGMKHAVIMQALGVAKKFNVSQNQAFNDLLPVMQSWDVRTDPVSTLTQNARWAFTQGQECTVSGLRTLGVNVPKLSRPE